jgi:hypothetical protein
MRNSRASNIEIRFGDKATISFQIKAPLTKELKQIILERAAFDFGALCSSSFKQEYEKAYFGKWRGLNEMEFLYT